MSVVGYIRVSSTKQTCAHQSFEMKQFAAENGIHIDRFVTETISSRKPLSKRKLGRLLNDLHDGDILISCEISRLGRSLLEVMGILENCMNKNCQVWTIKERYKLGNDIQSKVMAFAFGLAAEIERNLISQRTKSSLENLRARGKKLGRPVSSQSKSVKLSENKHEIRKLLNSGLSKTFIAQKFDVEPVTLRRFMRRMKWV